MMKMAMFSDAKVGDRVYSWRNGWGTIIGLSWGSKFPIGVEFDNKVICGYTGGGFDLEGDANPSIFWDKPQFEIPKKPFNLKLEYKKLKRKEFVQGEKNYNITIHWTCTERKWGCYGEKNTQAIGERYYEGGYINDFVNLLNDNEITFEQLEQVIKEVENERIQKYCNE